MYLSIDGLKLHASIGCYPWEKVITRVVALSLKLLLNTHNTTLKDTIDYDTLHNELSMFLSDKNYDTVEQLAKSVYTFLLSHTNVQKCTVEVNKLYALSYVFDSSVSVIAK